jgi:23S rRNA (pseudouridine1915-N3)-methyltransferase
MNIKLIAIGKTDNKALQSLIDDYTKRLSFIKFELDIIPDIKNKKLIWKSTKESELILAKITPRTNWFYGKRKNHSSVGFSEELQKMNSGVKL